MDCDGVPVDLDYTKVEAINPRRTNAFVNNFITTSNHFVNRYLATCEERLAEVEQAETHLNVLVATLESKLASVAFLQEAKAAELAAAPPPPPSLAQESSSSATNVIMDTTVENAPEPPPVIGQEAEAESANRVAACKHPVYKRYFDLKKYGVPDGQILMNMKAQGVDPDKVRLDAPDELIDVDIQPVKPSPGNGSTSQSSADTDEFSE